MQTVLAAVLDESTPAAADIEDPGTRTDVDGVECIVELAGDAVLEGFVRILEDALRIRAVAAVEEGEVEVGVVLVVVLDVLVVAAHLSTQPRPHELADVLQGVTVGEDRPQVQHLRQVALHVEVSVEEGLAGAHDVEAGEGLQPGPVGDDQGGHRAARPDRGLGAVGGAHGDGRAAARGVVAPAELGHHLVRRGLGHARRHRTLVTLPWSASDAAHSLSTR